MIYEQNIKENILTLKLIVNNLNKKNKLNNNFHNAQSGFHKLYLINNKQYLIFGAVTFAQVSSIASYCNCMGFIPIQFLQSNINSTIAEFWIIFRSMTGK